MLEDLIISFRNETISSGLHHSQLRHLLSKQLTRNKEQLDFLLSVQECFHWCFIRSKKRKGVANLQNIDYSVMKNCIRNCYKLALTVAKTFVEFSQFILSIPQYANDMPIICALLKHNGKYNNTYLNLNDDMRNNPFIIKETLRRNSSMLYYVPKELITREIMLVAIKQNGGSLLLVEEFLQDDNLIELALQRSCFICCKLYKMEGYENNPKMVPYFRKFISNYCHIGRSRYSRSSIFLMCEEMELLCKRLLREN